MKKSGKYNELTRRYFLTVNHIMVKRKIISLKVSVTMDGGLLLCLTVNLIIKGGSGH